MDNTSPIGSSKATTSLTPSAIPSSLSFESLSLSRSASDIPLFLAYSISLLFSVIISSACATSASATLSNALFFSFCPSFAKSLDAALAFIPNSSSIFFLLILFFYDYLK